MNTVCVKHIFICSLISVLSWLTVSNVSAQSDTIQTNTNSNETDINIGKMPMPEDSLQLIGTDSIVKKRKRDWNTWRPTPKRALWLALVLPGAGQIYNRKYWKLPIVYGGFVGCVYAIRWNNQMYHDYSQAYMDLVDNDSQTHSYDQFLHLGNKITPENIERYKELFRKRKDRYRRWRDLSIFTMIGVYVLSVIDAYVDASLSEFDISDNLTLRVSPTIINNNTERNPFNSAGLGLQCSISF
ncbi:DUF5683 domain-containing protein [Hoylesella oralis]|uniref:DUF5683 domain-containing protein n=1 Tax=Hoylesella oralis TaxID=28134 RepID=UPI0028EDC055|nr:DUF5683 domain-containing protein [Hoylesella oralis]